MKLSQSLSYTSKTTAHDEGSVNARLLTQAGFVKKEAAGIYSYLPFGLRVLTRISEIVRSEMDTVAGQEVLMPALTPAENWVTTGRLEVPIAYRPDAKTVLGWSHEEMVTPLAKQRIKSYRDLPLSAYQIQTKFRNEPRAKSGLLRGREFLMKDMYSFHATQADLDQYYEQVKQAYFRVFARCGLQAYLVEATGGEFTQKRSHEFQVATEAGEDNILVCEPCGKAWNDELSVTKCEACGGELAAKKMAEVGNIFDLNTRYSEPFDLRFTAEDGSTQLVLMGCYGIGISRLIATIAEVHHDSAGLIWPESVAPFAVHLISLGKEESAHRAAEQLYAELRQAGVEVLWDDRAKIGTGEKLGDADLIGCPLRVVVSPRTLESGMAELKQRHETDSRLVPLGEVLGVLGR